MKLDLSANPPPVVTVLANGRREACPAAVAEVMALKDGDAIQGALCLRAAVLTVAVEYAELQLARIVREHA
ncbi:MAG TPA: hypothetical protein PKA07_11360 [Micropruina sp.]|nr:hypothetical protein [Micropruina sp.]